MLSFKYVLSGPIQRKLTNPDLGKWELLKGFDLGGVILGFACSEVSSGTCVENGSEDTRPRKDCDPENGSGGNRTTF